MLAALASLIVWTGCGADRGEDVVEADIAPNESAVRWTVKRGNLTISALAPGELRTENTTQIYNPVKTYRQLKVTWVIEEGQQVRAGDRMIEFDASEIRERYLQQKIKYAEAVERSQKARDDLAITQNRLDTETLIAENNLKIAEIDMRKYVEGDYPQQERQYDAEAQMAEESLRRAQDKLEWTDRLYAKKYVTEMDLEADQFGVLRNELERSIAVEALKLSKEFTRERELTMLESQVIEAKGSLGEVHLKGESEINSRNAAIRSAVDREEIERMQRDDLKDQLDNTILRAPKDGMVVFFKNRSRYGSSESVLQVGSQVTARQRLIDLPDFSSWIIEARVHESLIQQILLGQPAFLTLDAFPDQILEGTVSKIAVLPDSQNWMRDVQEYLVEIDLKVVQDNFKPGMSGKAEIIIKEIRDVLIVPVQAVNLRGGKTVIWVQGELGPFRQEVEIGLMNDRFVEIVTGLSEGQQVILEQTVLAGSGLGPRPSEMASGEQRQSAGQKADRAEASPRRGTEADAYSAGEGQPGAGHGQGPPPGFDPSTMSPEDLQKMREQYMQRGEASGMDPSQMTPEQRQQMRERMMKQGGFDPSTMSPEDIEKMRQQYRGQGGGRSGGGQRGGRSGEGQRGGRRGGPTPGAAGEGGEALPSEGGAQ